ncbi:type I polyketide synthase [Roseovarius aquimarinus]|uniref:SDR family NAD(P)-dependent oxidoreductase n=1 Tax=Roseovarius aquimarinus TaxID=1229156 RepID=A0ABW7I5Q9_9RHOB
MSETFEKQAATGPSGDIAIVGMAADVPGAPDLARFWENLVTGTESITRLGRAALIEAGEDPAMLARKNYVPAAALLEGLADFDAEFFGFGPREAAILDPQHRKFLEVTWAAMEQADHAPRGFAGRIGVFAGCGQGSYFHDNIRTNPDLVEDVGLFLLRHTGNDKDFLSTRVSHVFDLKGPSVTLQTACSTSLVAVHYARQALIRGECDMALAGGVTIELPHGRGYLYKENEILSPDGHCHAFDHRAAGTVFGSGAGAVALRRLEDALADGDHIWAVIKGSAINNDGAQKAGYLAPSVEGQAAAVRAALADARVEPESIGYIECHGTGTYLGDPIEVAALNAAHAGARGLCHIGSVKTNIGHLDTAAGVVGLIKAALALHHAQIPPSLNFEAPNPEIDFAGGRFAVADRLMDWNAAGQPRRAGVNSLGVGGTNAHVVLEEAPARAASEPAEFPFHVLTLSARSKPALDAASAALAAHLRAHPETPLADIAWTLREGRHGFAKRRCLVAATHEEAAALLEAGDPLRVHTHEAPEMPPQIVFMFPGGGAQYPGMARDLYETEPVFADWMDRGLDHLAPQLGYDIRALWLPEPGDVAAAAEALKTPSVQLPLIMITEFALAQLWMSWGVRPDALVGHSMGENTAAALAGVMTFEGCIDLVLLRGRLFDSVPPGGMLSVPMRPEDLAPLMGDALDIASINAPGLCAVSGPQAALADLAERLAAEGIECQRIAIDIAAHSRMLDPILPQFRAHLEGLSLNAPSIPILSNRSGAPLSEAEATDPAYWTDQLRHTVRFAACIDALGARPSVFLEVGPGRALASLAQMAPQVGPGRAFSTLRHPDQAIADDAHFLGVIGRLWASGIEADWGQIWGGARRSRVVLPGYQFQRSRYFIEPARAHEAAAAVPRAEDIAEWGFVPRWRPAPADCDIETEASLGPRRSWLFFADDAGVAESIIAALGMAGHGVTTVRSGDSFQRRGAEAYILAPEQGREGYEALFSALAADGRLPERIVHLWGVTGAETHRPGSSFFDRNLEHGLRSLTHLAQAMAGAALPEGCHLSVVTSQALRIGAEDAPGYPEKACVLGPVGVIPREFPGLTAQMIDIERPPAPHGRLKRAEAEAAEARRKLLMRDLLAEPGCGVAAHRGGQRLERVLRAQPLPAPEEPPVYVPQGVYLVTGGFGGIGASVARDIARRAGGHVVLLSRRAMQPRGDWDRLSQGSGRDAARIRLMREIEALGGRATALVADVTDLADMQRVRAEIARIGPLSGIIHAAGVIDDAPILSKDDARMEAVLAPKIAGLRVLEEIFPDGAAELLVLFSSTSTATTPAGQVDYVAANAYFDAVAEARRGGQTRVLCVNWGVWSEIGMAAEAMARRTGAVEAAPQPLDLPLLRDVGEDADGAARFALALSPERDWVLAEHRTRAGHILLPGTAMVELAAEAMAPEGAFKPFALTGLAFLRPFLAEPGKIEAGSLHLTEEGALSLRRHVTLDGRGGMLVSAEGRLEPMQGIAPRIDLDAIAARCDKPCHEAGGGDFASPQEAHLAFGPRWRVLTRAASGPGEGLAHLSLPEEFHRDLAEGWRVHPALLDISTGWAIGLHEAYAPEDLWVPAGYAALRVHAPLPADIVSWVRLRPAPEAGTALFDITIAAPDGEVLIEAEGLRMQRLPASALARLGAPPAPRDVIFEPGEAAPLSPAETRLMRQIVEGITPAEGTEALARAISLARTHGTARLAISPFDLNALIEEARRAAAAPTASATSFERPALEGDYVAPREGIESELADIWSSLLGISQIGAEDSFFDLGGHSLLAVRLFAQVKQRYGVDFPLAVLFEAPSIAALARRIEEAGGGAAEAPDATADAPTGRDTPQHLVPLHPDMRKEAAPLFIVAGMFGNVLNLRQLALLTGKERPVWGLQARGLMGGAAPHTRMEDAAADCIAEIRSVQPEGPYHLAGFSGGGITAFEIAQQLAAAGEEVATLALLDTPLPVRPPLGRADKALIKLQELRRKGPRYFGEWASARLRWELSKRRMAPQDTAPGAFHNAEIERAFRTAAAAYTPRPWNGPVTLYRPPLDRHWRGMGGAWISAAREYVLEDNGWSALCPRLEIVEVPGDHDSMVLVPNVSVLAGHVSARIARAEGRGEAERGSDGWSGRTAAE